MFSTSMRYTLPFALVAIAVSSYLLSSTHAAEPKETKPLDPPRIAMCVPLALPTGVSSKLIVRGWGLAEAKEVRSSNPKLTIKIVAGSKCEVPNGQDAKLVGDTQIELEVTIAADVEIGKAELTIVSPSGESKPHTLLVGSGHLAIIENESNDGFRQAQKLQVPQVVDGQIHADRNVDVFEFELLEKQSVSIEVIAHRQGSNLDSLLTLFDTGGTIIAVSDDHSGTADSQITADLPAGKYFISLQDAHDHGGPAHPYRLVVAAKP
ncbi:MAG: hypothetical protein ACI9G1_001309 [Pirellulaceae bacterium]|jgi:hypothetical protein